MGRADQSGGASRAGTGAAGHAAQGTPAHRPAARDIDWARIRQRFPVFERRNYLNSCSYGALSLEVARAGQRYFDERLHKGVDWPDWVEHNPIVVSGRSSHPAVPVGRMRSSLEER